MTSTNQTDLETLDQDPNEITATAEREVADAERNSADLEQRVRDGDEKVTPTMLDKAAAAVRFTRLRVDHAKVRADRVRQRQHTAAVERFHADYERFVTDTDLDPLRERYSAAGKAVAALRDAVQHRAAAEAELKAGAADLGLDTGGDGTPLVEDRERWSRITVRPDVWREVLRDAEGPVNVLAPGWQGRVHNLRTEDERAGLTAQRAKIDQASAEADAARTAAIREHEAEVRRRRSVFPAGGQA